MGAAAGIGRDGDNGSAYLFRDDGSGWKRAAMLLANDGAPGDKFGCSVAVSGGWAIVGAYLDDDKGDASGSVYFFQDQGASGWVQVAKRTASDGAPHDEFGWSVSISGTRAIVGAHQDDDRGEDSGSAYVFEYNGSAWEEVAKLTAEDGAAEDNFGESVSISGDRAIVGAWLHLHGVVQSGSAYVFEANGGDWDKVIELRASDPDDYDLFGRSVSLDGATAVVGVCGDDDNGDNSGSAYVFRDDGSGWAEIEKLLPADGAASDWFGRSVSLSGQTALVGAWADDEPDENSGSAYLFREGGPTWTQVAKLLPGNGNEFSQFGEAVSLSGDNSLVGGSRFPWGHANGSAYVFQGASQVAQLSPTDNEKGDEVGASVAISGDTAIVGAPGYRLPKSECTEPGYCELIAQANMGWVRQVISWNIIEPAEGQYNFDYLDEAIDAIYNAGLQTHAIIVPNGGCVADVTTGDPAALATWAAFLTRVCDRYKDRIKYWEIGNEEDSALFWNPPNAANYKAFLQTSCEVLKARDPQCKVIMGGLMGWGYRGIEFFFLDELYEAGGFPYFDILGIHPYVLPFKWDRGSGDHSERMAVADVNGDSKDEVILSRADPGASGTWAMVNAELGADASYVRVFPEPADVVTAGDVDGDGREEVFVGRPDSLYRCDFNTATGEFTSAAIYDLCPAITMTADTDGDGNDELMAGFTGAGERDGVLVWDPGAQPDPTWTKIRSQSPVCVAAADIDGDGKDEVAAGFAGDGLWVWDPDSADPWTNIHAQCPGPAALSAGDVDGDGLREFVVSLGAGGLWSYAPQGFTRLYDGSPSINVTLLDCGDVNGDGFDEVVMNDGWGHGKGVYVLDLRFKINTLWTTKSPNDIQILAGDINGDARDDVIVDFGAYINDDYTHNDDYTQYPWGIWTFDLNNWTDILESRIQDAIDRLDSHPGGNEKRIWITEIGWPSNQRGGSIAETSELAVSEEQQAELMRAWLTVIGEYPQVDRVDKTIWYCFRDQGADSTIDENNYGLRHDNTPKPAYEMLRDALDADGNGTPDALSDGILILRYLFDPTGAWNVNDALGAGATRTTREAIKTFLDAGRTGVLDADGNGTADALSDGILLLRYLFDPTGAWNVNDAIGAGAVRTTRQDIRAYLDACNPHSCPAPPMMAGATVPDENLSAQSVPADPTSFAVDTTGPVNSNIEPVSGSDADQVRAAISQALVIGDTSTSASTGIDQKSIPDEGSQPEGLLAVDTALESWNQPAAYDVTVGWMPNQGAPPSNDEEADQLWGDGDLDWFLNSLGDDVNDLEAGEIAAAF